MLKSESRKIHQVKCIVSPFVKGKTIILGPKFDTLEKHARKTKAVHDMLHLGNKEGEFHINNKCSCTKNDVTYSQ
jgi:hypothetical protein